MDDVVREWLILAALVILIIMFGLHSYLLLRLMGDTEKFGRLLKKVRQKIKAGD